MVAILGINAYHGDSSAALIVDGKMVAGVEEERLNRIKHWAGFPVLAIRYCLEEANLKGSDIDHVAFSRDPMAHLASKALFTVRHRVSPRFVADRLKALTKSRNAGNSLAEALRVKPGDLRAKVHWVEHHRAHSASAFLVSPFESAAVVSVDAFGDFRSTMVSDGEGLTMRPISTVGFPHSLGLFYTAMTQYLGFLRYGDEYKVMGLASYGKPAYVEELRKMISLEPDGGFKLNLRYFVHTSRGASMTWDNCEPTIGRLFSPYMEQRLGPARQPTEPLAAKQEDMAHSLQAVMEEVYFHVLNHAHQATGKKALALAGGVAFNSVANGKIFDQTPFEDVYIQAAAGDAGTALGAAMHVYTDQLRKPRTFVMNTAYWGPHYSDDQLAEALKRHDLPAAQLDEGELYRRTALAISEGKIVGWFQGRLEWGPRALGNRSIIVDPRRADMKDILNARIKRREPFRPFAPSILLEAVGDYFEKTYPDPFMIKVYKVKPEKRAVIPAVTHVDGTGRLQTVSREDNPSYWSLIKEFERQTGVPVVLNTSFNENEPIVCTPDNAIDCFTRTKMDVLVLGPYFLAKESVPTDAVAVSGSQAGSKS